MSPAGTLDLIGPAAVMIYARALLAKVGVEAEIIHIGRYKGAGDMFIRDDMPEEAKASMDAILDDLYGALIEATKVRTEGQVDKAKALIDGGPYGSAAAADAGLVDSVSFLRDSREEIKKAAGVDTIRRTRMLPKQDQLTLGQFLNLFSGETEKTGPGGERVALVFVNGHITDGESGSMGDAVSGPFVRVMQRLEDDDNVKAVVMRINSPGGSALASDRMWDAAHHLAEAKPLIASVGDMAASGGYYIASAADEILAHPNSLVGSIGVVGGKFNFAGLAEDIGVNAYVLQRGKRAAWSTPVRALNPTERQAFESLLRELGRGRETHAGRGLPRGAARRAIGGPDREHSARLRRRALCAASLLRAGDVRRGRGARPLRRAFRPLLLRCACARCCGDGQPSPGVSAASIPRSLSRPSAASASSSEQRLPSLQRLTGMGPMTSETVGSIAERAAALVLHGLMTPGEIEA